MSSLNLNVQSGGDAVKDLVYFFKNALASKAGAMVLLIIFGIHYFIIWKFYLRKRKYLFFIALAIILFFVLVYFKWFHTKSDDGDGDDSNNADNE